MGKAYEVHRPPIRIVENDLGVESIGGMYGLGIPPQMWMWGARWWYLEEKIC
jgi:hypothetical protein